MKMKTAILSALLTCFLAAGCAMDVLSTEPEVDIDPDKLDDPVPPQETRD